MCAESASKAASLAEAAFFQPSIMSVLYNPTEHHLAIYTVRTRQYCSSLNYVICKIWEKNTLLGLL